MKNLNFKYAKATNTLCFGPDGVEFHLSDYGNVVLVEGINLDNPGSDDNPASNGAGKSSVQEIISIGLYGRTVKSPKQLKGVKIVNELAGEKGKATIEIEWDDYRVVRTVKAKGGTTLDLWHSPNHIWDDETLLSKGAGVVETQKMIEEKLGMSHHAFCNVVIFDDSNSFSFLEADAPTKREIVENLLGLDKYREYAQNAKELFKGKKNIVDEKTREYERSLESIEACAYRITKIETQQGEWKRKKELEAKQLEVKLGEKQLQLEKTDKDGELTAYNKAKERIGDLNEDVGKKNEAKAKALEWLETAKKSLAESEIKKNAIQLTIQKHVLEIREVQANLEKSALLVQKLQNLEDGATCPACHSVINHDNYAMVVVEENNKITRYKRDAQRLTVSLEEEKTKLGKLSAIISKVEDGILDAERKINLIQEAISKGNNEISKLSALPRPDVNAAQRVLETEISEIKRQIKEKQEELSGGDPYKEILESAKTEREAAKVASERVKKELEGFEKELPYYEFWVKAFGDKGIRKFVVEGVIPALNSRIAYWMQYLIDGKMELKFNNEFEETITRNGTPAYYYGLSNGERRRVNLAVSQAFAHVMMLNTGYCPSLVFLDEITGGGIDRAGISGIFNMIFELAKERRVFVTTHNQYLLQMLEGCEVLTLRKENDITVLLK